MKIRKWQPRVEALESRWVPALLLQLDGAGNLTGIFGTPAGPVDLAFTADDEVNVMENGSDLGTYSVPGDLKVTLGNVAGAEALTVDFAGNSMSGSLAIGTGNALSGWLVTLTAGTISGNLSVNTGNGPDTIDTEAAVLGSMSVNTRAGFDTLNTNPGSDVSGNVYARNVQNYFSFANIEGNYLYDTSRESLDGGCSCLGAFSTTIGGNAVIRGGAGDDGWQQIDGGSIAGNLSVNLGGGDNAFAILGAFTVLGNVTYVSGNGDDVLPLGNAGAYTIGGNLTLSMGGGDDALSTIDATVLGSAVTVVMGNGDDTWTNTSLTAPGARATFLGQNGDDTVDWSAGNPVLASAYLDGGYGTNDFIPDGVIDFPFTLRNFV